MHGGGHLVDLGHLLVHALVGSDGDVGGVLGRIADLLHRTHYLADHGLQLGQEGIEALGDGTQLVGAVAVQATGQVAFALGDVVEHRHHLLERAGDAQGQQPDHQQAKGGDAEANEGHAGDIGTTLFGQILLQLVDLSHHGAQRQFQQQCPAGIGVGDLERQVQLDAILAGVHFVVQGFAAQAVEGAGFVAVQHIAGLLAEFRRVTGIGHQAAVAGNQRQLAGAVVQLAIGGIEQVLDEVHRQVGTGHALELAIDHDRFDERRQHDHLVAHFIRRGVDHAGLLRLLGAQVVLAGAHAGGEDCAVVDIGQLVLAKAAIAIAEPPGQEAAVGAVDTHQAAADVAGIGMVEGIWLPAKVSAEHAWIDLHGALELVDQVLAVDPHQRLAVASLHAEHGVAGGQAAGDRQRSFEAALDLADLGARQGGEALLDDVFELLLGALLHQGLGALPGVDGVQHQGRDNTQHDGTGQGGYGKLDRLELHGKAPRARRSLPSVIGGLIPKHEDLVRNLTCGSGRGGLLGLGYAARKKGVFSCVSHSLSAC